MQTRVKEALPGVVCVLLLAAGLAFFSRPRVLSGDPTGAVPLEMPVDLGSWHGENVLFCTSDQCGRSFLEKDLRAGVSRDELASTVDFYLRRRHKRAGTSFPEASPADGPVTAEACPFCGSPLSTISIAERMLLPKNTPVFRRRYSLPGHPELTATVLFSGMHRDSIHKPQGCLVAQGNRLVDEYTIPVKIGPGRTLGVRAIEVSAPQPDGSFGPVSSVYAYWLFNPERETDSHFVRFVRTMFDNLVRSYRPRWGYASVSIPVDPVRPDAWKTELEGFLAVFHPLVSKCRADMDARRDRTVVVRDLSSDVNTYEGTGPTTSSPTASAPASAGADAE